MARPFLPCCLEADAPGAPIGSENRILERIALDWNREAIQERMNPLGQTKESVFRLTEHALGVARIDPGPPGRAGPVAS